MLPEGRRLLPLLIQHLVDDIHVRENVLSHGSSGDPDVQLLLLHLRAPLLGLVQVILIPSKLRDLRGVPERNESPVWELQGEVPPNDLLRHSKGGLLSHLRGELRVVGSHWL